MRPNKMGEKWRRVATNFTANLCHSQQLTLQWWKLGLFSRIARLFLHVFLGNKHFCECCAYNLFLAHATKALNIETKWVSTTTTTTKYRNVKKIGDLCQERFVYVEIEERDENMRRTKNDKRARLFEMRDKNLIWRSEMKLLKFSITDSKCHLSCHGIISPIIASLFRLLLQYHGLCMCEMFRVCFFFGCRANIFVMLSRSVCKYNYFKTNMWRRRWLPKHSRWYLPHGLRVPTIHSLPFSVCISFLQFTHHSHYA